MSSGDSYKTQTYNLICNLGEKCKQTGSVIYSTVEKIPHVILNLRLLLIFTEG